MHTHTNQHKTNCHKNKIYNKNSNNKNSNNSLTKSNLGEEECIFTQFERSQGRGPVGGA